MMSTRHLFSVFILREPGFFLKDLIIFKDTLRFSKHVSNICKGIPKLSSYHLQYFQLENSKDMSDLK